MPRAALSQDQVDEFRDALCAAATRLFAEHGYEGVTMRALAKNLGCSAMTPYRYFENKAEIFETVRFAAADRFADAIDGAVRAHADHRERLVAMTHAYVGSRRDACVTTKREPRAANRSGFASFRAPGSTCVAARRATI